MRAKTFDAAVESHTIPVQSRAYVFAAIADEPVPLGVVDTQKDDQGRPYFRFDYADSWRALPGAFTVDPVHMRLWRNKTADYPVETATLPSVLADALPDAWGQRVQAAIYRSRPRNDIERLITTRGGGVGCLIFSGSRSRPPRIPRPPSVVLVGDILRAASEVEAREIVNDDALIKLLVHGTSMGGARPKCTVSHHERDHLLKLPREGDVIEHARAEKAFQAMASVLGIRTVHTEILETHSGPALLMSRFDRDEKGVRLHYISARSLMAKERLSVSASKPRLGYCQMAEKVSVASARTNQDLRELFTRMALNVAVGNTDDHLLNHGMQYVGGGYRLAPLFDVVTNLKNLSTHAIELGLLGREASLENVLTAHAKFGLSFREASEILKDVLAVANDADHYLWAVDARPADVDLLTSVCRRFSPEMVRDVSEREVARIVQDAERAERVGRGRVVATMSDPSPG